MNRFAAAIFDMDGLLLDSERVALRAFRRACEQFDLGDETALFLRCVGINATTGRQILEEGLEGKADPEAFATVWESQYLEIAQVSPIPLKEGVHELLDYLAELGIPTAVATSTATKRAVRKLQDAGLLGRFRVIVGGDQVEFSKPHPGIYLRAAALLDVSPETCVAFEDSEMGVRSALGARMFVIQIPDLVQPSPELIGLGHRILPSLLAVRASFE